MKFNFYVPQKWHEPSKILLNKYIKNNEIIYNITYINNSTLEITKNKNDIQIKAKNINQYFRALKLFVENIDKTQFIFKETSYFDSLTVMVDCSRNAILNIFSLKLLIEKLAFTGYTGLMLYTEDTYEIDNEPYFGYMRGRFTKNDLIEIDTYAEKFGIEVIPCIQTLAHLNSLFRWKKYYDICDCEDILLVGEEETYQLIDKMFSSMSKSLKSRKINIGMDEAHMLGRGKYLNNVGYENRLAIMKKHLNKVLAIAEKYGYTPMMWSDMFFTNTCNGSYNSKELSDESTNSIPKNVDLIYWNYFDKDKEKFDKNLNLHRHLKNKILCANGAIAWTGFVPHNNFSIESNEVAIKSCVDNDIKNYIVTVWGDDGGECSLFSVLPTIFAVAEIINGNLDKHSYEKSFKNFTGISYSDYLALDLPDTTYFNEWLYFSNISKCLFYNDAFIGLMDSLAGKINNNPFNNFEKIYSKIYKKSKNTEFAILFKNAKLFSKVLSLKYDLGIKTRKFYLDKNYEALENLANQDYNYVIKAVKNFYKSYKEQWLFFNKSFGLEIIEYRIGGLISRLESCRKRLLEYSNCTISKIDELEEKTLDIDNALLMSYSFKVFNSFKQIISANNLSW